MGSYDTNLRRGVFRSGELNTENAIPSLGGFPEAGASDIRSEAAMRGAAARIVEIGGQFDTQHLLESSGPGPNLKHVTAAGNALRERAARFHASRAKESRKAPDLVQNEVASRELGPVPISQAPPLS